MIQNNDLFAPGADDLMADVAADVAREPDEALVNQKLGTVSEYLRERLDLTKKRERLEADLKVINDRIGKIEGELVPDIFDDLGFSQIKLADGTKVEVETTYATSITKANQVDAHRWLRDHGHEGLIKHVVAVTLKKGDPQEVHDELIDKLRELKVGFKDDESVHASTLKAFVKEQLSGPEAVEFPRDLFSVFTLRRTKTS